MELQHTFTVPIGIEAAWAAFTDIERIAPCLPGAVITSVDGDSFTGTAKVKLGPIALQYSGKGTWVSRDDVAYSAVIDAQGKDKRGNGTAGAVIRAHLEPVASAAGGPGASTKVIVDTELKITGRPAQFGRGVIQDVGTKILDQFAACLVTRLAEPAAEPVRAAAEPGPSEAEPEPPPAGPQRTPTPPAEPVRSSSAEPAELDLGDVVGSVLLKRLRPAAAAAAVVAVIVWLIARR